MRTSHTVVVEDMIPCASGSNVSRHDAHRDPFAEFNDDGYSPPTSRPCTPTFGDLASDDPFIYTSGFTDDTYDVHGHLLAQFEDDRYEVYPDHLLYAPDPSKPTATSSESLEYSATERIQRLPQIETSWNTPSPDIISQTCPDDNCSSGLSTPVSSTPEDCPCQCGGFRESCYLLTLPPSPLHYVVKGFDGAEDQHYIVSDPQQVEDKQNNDLKEAMQDLNDRLERWNDSSIPPRCLQPWSEPATPSLQHDGHIIGGMYMEDLISQSKKDGVSMSSAKATSQVSATDSFAVHKQSPRSYTPPSPSELSTPIKPQEASWRLVATMSKAAAAYPTPQPSSITAPTCHQRLHDSLVTSSSRKRTRHGDSEEDDEAQRQLWPKRRCWR